MIIHVNRCDSYVVIDGNNHLEWDNQDIASAEVFTRVTYPTGFKLRTSGGMWVRVDNANGDDVVADGANEADGSLFDAPVCADGWVGITFVGDDDANQYWKADENNMASDQLRAINGECAINGVSWEKMELCVDGMCQLAGSANNYCITVP